LLHARRANLRKQDELHSSGSMSIVSRIRFERYKHRAESYMLKAREQQVGVRICQNSG
jgi:hypothetical protein